MEYGWFKGALATLNNLGYISYGELVPLRQPWRASIVCATWGGTMWKFFRAWCLCRFTGGLPLVLWELGDVPGVLPACPGCGRDMVGLKHIVEDCSMTARHRASVLGGMDRDILLWALSGDADVARLKIRVRFVGACLASLAHALGTDYREGRKRKYGVASI